MLRTYKKWSESEDRYLKANLDKPNEYLAEKLERTEKSIEARKLHLGDQWQYSCNSNIPEWCLPGTDKQSKALNIINKQLKGTSCKFNTYDEYKSFINSVLTN